MSLEKRPPTYELTKSEGPSHDPHFEMVCSFNESLAETGFGKTKKQAKKQAGMAFVQFESKL
jgi:dsRNA-specific ribonuclease